MSPTADQLYQLLPAIYRIRDAELGEPLKALIAVIAEQADVMEADIAGLYENWFIETCDEWVVPYIGDLLGVRGLYTVKREAAFSQRARVANTLSYRRRKGTATMLEQLAHDTTGWNARAVEFFELLGWTQYYNHIRLHSVRTPDLRRTNELELLDTAFDTIAHTVDVRHIASGRGRHNIPNIGIFLWRLQSYFVPRGSVRPVATPTDGRYTFSPLGYDAPLFNRPQTETEITHLAEEINVPGLLRRRPLYDELEARRQALIDGRTPEPVYFGKQPVLQVFVQLNSGDPVVEVLPEEILICNLSDPNVPIPDGWRRPPTSKNYKPSGGGPDKPRAIKVAVDPVLGRLAFPSGVKPNQVKVSSAYGFGGDVGGGPYNRRDAVAEVLTRKVGWQVGVSKEVAPVAGKIFATLTEAVTAWNSKPPGTVGVIIIMDSLTYQEDLTGSNRIKIPQGSQLLIVAADWSGQGEFDPDERRPHLRGDISVRGTAPDDSLTPGELALDGLLVEGGLTVEGSANGNLGSLRVAHCTFVPHTGGVAVSSKNNKLKIRITHSLSGPIQLAESVPALQAEDSIVDGAGGKAIVAKGTAVELQKCTVFGRTEALHLEAGNSLFTDLVTVERQQIGCVRFSYVPPQSKTPRRFRCQPDLALVGIKPEAQAVIRARLAPSFTSETYGHYGYGQLSQTCAEELRTGAENGSEMGAFSFLLQPLREANLRASLDEYLRFGLEAGLIFVT